MVTHNIHHHLLTSAKHGIGKKMAPRSSRRTRLAQMPKEILDVGGAAGLLGVSTHTVYQLARKGSLPGTRVGREWRFHRQTLIDWVASGAQADALSTMLSKVQPAKRRR
jgi:excisionase family DNA binding protein